MPGGTSSRTEDSTTGNCQMISAGLAEYVDNDVKLLEEILPNDEKLMVDNWPTLLYLTHTFPVTL